MEIPTSDGSGEQHPSEIHAGKPDFFKFTEIQTEIYRWLNTEAPPLAELYKGARSIFETRTPGWSRFVPHAVREIGNRLADHLHGEMTGGRYPYNQVVDQLEKYWIDEGFNLGGTLAQLNSMVNGEIPDQPTLSVSARLLLALGELIKGHHAARQRPFDVARRLFDFCDPQNQFEKESLRPLVDQWRKIIGWAQSKAHDSGKGNGDSDFDVAEYTEMIDLFETTLYSLRGKFFVVTGGLDEILEDTNS